jgi:hypothetical protein
MLFLSKQLFSTKSFLFPATKQGIEYNRIQKYFNQKIHFFTKILYSYGNNGEIHLQIGRTAGMRNPCGDCTICTWTSGFCGRPSWLGFPVSRKLQDFVNAAPVFLAVPDRPGDRSVPIPFLWGSFILSNPFMARLGLSFVGIQ